MSCRGFFCFQGCLTNGQLLRLCQQQQTLYFCHAQTIQKYGQPQKNFLARHPLAQDKPEVPQNRSSPVQRKEYKKNPRSQGWAGQKWEVTLRIPLQELPQTPWMAPGFRGCFLGALLGTVCS